MGLVRIKVIRLKSLLLSIVALALIVSLLTFFFVSYLKPKTIAAMADISSESSRSYIQKIDQRHIQENAESGFTRSGFLGGGKEGAGGS